MTFEWDAEKAESNRRKHGVAFEQAVRVFADPAVALELFDEAHSDFEDRFITIGPIQRGLALVVWTERDGDVVRIISARWATPAERRLYRRRMERADD